MYEIGHNLEKETKELLQIIFSHEMTATKWLYKNLIFLESLTDHVQ